MPNNYFLKTIYNEFVYTNCDNIIPDSLIVKYACFKLLRRIIYKNNMLPNARIPPKQGIYPVCWFVWEYIVDFNRIITFEEKYYCTLEFIEFILSNIFD